MKKYFLSAILFSNFAFAQVGINTQTPQATFDVTASPLDLTKTDGIIAPRITGNQLRAKNARYTAAQDGAIVYVTAGDDSPAGKTANITSTGYYYFDKTLNSNNGQWVKMINASSIPANTNIYTNNGSLTGTRLVNQEGFSLAFQNANGANAFSVRSSDLRGSSIFAVDGLTSRVGIGTPDPTVKLHINSGAEPGFRLVDGTQASGRILTSNSSGVGTWQNLPAFDSTDDAFANDAANSMVKLATRSNGTTARSAGTEFVITDNGRLGVGTDAPDNNVHVTGGVTIGPKNAVQMRISDNRLQVNNASGVQIGNISVAELPEGAVMNINSLVSTTVHTRLNINAGNVSIGGTPDIIPTEKLMVEGAIKIGNGGYTGIAEGSSTPIPAGGRGTMVFTNGSFWGYTGTVWKRLHN